MPLRGLYAPAQCYALPHALCTQYAHAQRPPCAPLCAPHAFSTRALRDMAGIEIDDCSFHQCVKLGKFDMDRTISFVRALQ